MSFTDKSAPRCHRPTRGLDKTTYTALVALIDVLDGKTGKYLKTAEMGLQNFVLAIDPKTDDKKVDPALLPGDGKTVFICPHAGGGGNWLPSSFVQSTRPLYIMGRAVCMDLVPDKHGFMTSNVRMEFAPPPDSDGRYGVLQAIDLQSGKIRWQGRQARAADIVMRG